MCSIALRLWKEVLSIQWRAKSSGICHESPPCSRIYCWAQGEMGPCGPDVSLMP